MTIIGIDQSIPWCSAGLRPISYQGAEKTVVLGKLRSWGPAFRGFARLVFKWPVLGKQCCDCALIDHVPARVGAPAEVQNEIVGLRPASQAGN